MGDASGRPAAAEPAAGHLLGRPARGRQRGRRPVRRRARAPGRARGARRVAAARARQRGGARAAGGRGRGDRARERRSGGPHGGRAADARGRRRRARPAAGHGRAHDPPRRPADRVGRHVGPAARRGARRGGLRGAGRRPVGSGANGRVRRLRVRAVPRARRRRPDGRRGQRLDADVRDRERRPRQPGVLHVQRGARKGAAVRRQRHVGARPAGVDPRRAGARVRPGPCASRSTCGR